MPKTIQYKLHVYTFGGVVMIPKSLASVVQNYVFKGDLICRDGNKKNDPNGTLKKVIRITERSIVDGVSLKTALCEKFIEDWYKDLDPSSDRSAPDGLDNRQQKITTYLNTFWGGDPEKVQGIIDERYRAYASCMEDYNITLLPNPSEPSREMAAQVTDTSRLLQTMTQRVASYGSEMDLKWHRLEVFQSTLSDIAQLDDPVQILKQSFATELKTASHSTPSET